MNRRQRKKKQTTKRKKQVSDVKVTKSIPHTDTPCVTGQTPAKEPFQQNNPSTSRVKLNVDIWLKLNVLLVVLVSLFTWITALILHVHIGPGGYLADFLLVSISIVCNFQSLLSGSQENLDKDSVLNWHFGSIILGIACYIMYILIFTRQILEGVEGIELYLVSICIALLALITFIYTCKSGKEVSSQI